MADNTERTFKERYHQWQLSAKHTPRRWILLTLPFSEARHWFEVKRYNYLNNTGEQRDAIAAWVSTLRREMLADNFTPAGWSAGIRPSHAKSLVIDEKTKMATVTVSQNSKFAHIDGGHRGAAMLKILEAAEKAKDQATIDFINSCEVTIQIYLDPNRLKKDFTNLQEGRPVSKAQRRIMKIKNKSFGKDQPICDLALAVGTEMNRTVTSHLSGQVAFDASATNKMGIDTLTTQGASELACSIYGGAKIALHAGKDAAWLLNTYVEAYEAIKQHCAAEPDAPDTPAVLARGKILSPLGVFDGKKGGSSLILGIGNILAWRKVATNHNKATDADKQLLANITDDVFGDELSEGGLDAPRKRRLIGDFTMQYLADLVLEPGAAPVAGMYPGNEGIPQPLIDLLAPSAFGLKKKKKKDELPEEPLEEPAPEEEEEEEEEVKQETLKSSKKSRKPALVGSHQV
jgi:hypothetical protein